MAKVTITANEITIPGPQASQADLQAFADFMRAFGIPQKDGSPATPGDVLLVLPDGEYMELTQAQYQALNAQPAQ